MKKCWYLCLIGIMMLFLTGCGGTLASVVNLDENQAGSRVMTYTIPKEDFNQYVNGTIEQLDQTIVANCPAALSYQLSEDESNYTATFTLSFTSIEDYKEKVATLMTDEIPEIDCTICDSVFSTGIAYDESFNGKDLMGWFETLMVNSGYVSEDNRSYIIENQNASMYYQGVEYAGESYSYQISVSTVEYTSIDQIQIFTEPVIGGTYNRIINIVIPDSSYLTKKDEIDAFLEEGLGDGVTGVWSNELGMNTYTVTMSNRTLDNLQTDMQLFCHSDQCVLMQYTPVADSEEETYSYEEPVLFSEDYTYLERLDLGAFGCNENGTVDAVYFLSNPEIAASVKYTGVNDGAESTLATVFEETEDTQIGEFYYSYEDEVFPNYVRYDLGEIRDEDLYVDKKLYYHPSEICYNLDVKSANNMKCEVVFTFDEGISTDAIAKIAESVQTKIDESEAVTGVSVTAEESTFTVSQKGDAEMLNDQIELVTGRENVADIHYAEENKAFALTKTCALVTAIDMSGYIYTSEDEYWQIPVIVTINMGGKNTSITSDEDFVKSGNEYTTTTMSNLPQRKEIITHKVNGRGVAMILLTLVAVGAFFAAVIFLVIGFIKKGKNKSKAPKQPMQQQPMQQQPMQQQPMQQQPMQQQPMQQQPMQQQPMQQQPMQQQQAVAMSSVEEVQPVEEAPAEEPKVEEVQPVEETPAEEPKTEEVQPVVEATAEEPRAEEVQTEESQS